ncbi:GHMP kinase [Flavobacterium sp. Sd200]|uniref:GYDIA family GHMP kinase n=1 Tax=Flavobacterium sp. Sd200 TaxID=2692211 RepID=UPI00136950CC|nr:GYDIA family GHMP kinase [Flavobacterium sp. Sd200]MXN92221.1 GHMP kinase [Flavobacterium sp. Sd200]
MKKTFYSNGKLFITGEYTVLDGADAFALPTKQGQYLEVEETNSGIINWKSYDADGSVWLECSLPVKSVTENIPTGISPEADTLIEVLHHAHLSNPNLLKKNTGFDVETRLTFSRKWGLGTSSTFINNVAQWFKINAFQLLADSFGGSGYDIACAQNNTPVIYRINGNDPYIAPVDFYPTYANKLWFVYLNQKQNSREAIAAYRAQRQNIAPVITRINALTQDAIQAKDAQEFGSALEKHEALLSGVLGIAPVQERLFPEFKGVVKSLGAWGGDFVLAVSEENPIGYFKAKGYDTIVSYHDMIL